MSNKPNSSDRTQRAFVANLHDLLNSDLDFGDKASNLLDQVAYQRYEYVSGEQDRDNTYKHMAGRAYRCRLRNIKKTPTATYDESRYALHQLMCRVDLQNGWVDASIFACDHYRRGLVELFDPITGENLGAWLVREFPNVVQFY